MKCRHCNQNLSYIFADLSSSPPSNSYIKKEHASNFEKWYPLRVFVCSNCWLAQTEDFVNEEDMFSEEYAYFSSFSSSGSPFENISGSLRISPIDGKPSIFDVFCISFTTVI